jgi:hypothetical protein
MQGAEGTRAIILNTLYEKVERLCNEGCTIGKIHNQQFKETEKKIDGIEAKFWWLIGINFVTLIGIIFDVALNLVRVGLVK